MQKQIERRGKRKTSAERIVVRAECHRSNLGCSTRASLIQLIQKVILSLLKESSSLARLVLVTRSPRPRLSLASFLSLARLVLVSRPARSCLSLASFLVQDGLFSSLRVNSRGFKSPGRTDSFFSLFHQSNFSSSLFDPAFRYQRSAVVFLNRGPGN